MGLHDRFVNKEQLNQRERKIMSNGLSSIIDFADKSSKSQKSLFTSGTFEELEAMYQEKLKIEREELDPLIMHTCQIICSVVKKTKRISDGIDYLYKLYPKYLSVVDKKKQAEASGAHYVDASQLEKNASDPEETDYLRIVWSPIFQLLFPKDSPIVVKTGETSNKQSSLNKTEQYHTNKELSAFKIDVRLCVVKKKICIDLACCELSKHDADDKLIMDEGKLTREAKDITDHLISTLPYDQKRLDQEHLCYGWSIQLAGHTCKIATNHLVDNGLYVNLPRYQFSLPGNVVELPNIVDILEQLYTMKRTLHMKL
ncbi:hypothetical protein BDF14DRAFT_763857 [Spinellus fusiger]|nr:hypothetical protein BDF14DRAFT_763857 [Spinellus fusiger]